MRVLATAAFAFAILAACGSYGASDDGTAPPTDGGSLDGTTADGTPIVADAASESAPDGGRQVVVLATNQTGAFAIAANDSDAYWSDNDIGEIRTVPIAGGTTRALYTYGGSPTNLTVDSQGSVMWGDQGNAAKTGLRRISGGGVAVLLTNPVGSFASFADGTTAVVTSKNAFLTVYGADGGAGTAFGPYGSPVDVIRDGTTAVWTASADQQLWKLESGVASMIVDSESDCQQLATNADGIYWTRPFDGLIRKLDRANDKSTIADKQQEAYGIAADASGVYWLTTDGAVRHWSQSTGVVTLAAGQPAAIDPTLRVRAHALATTSSFVVWLTGQDVRRVEK